MKKTIVALGVCLCTLTGYGAPAFPGEITFKQPDGRHFSGHIKGDEWCNWIEDKQKNIVLLNRSSKQYEYAKIVEKDGLFDLAPSGIKVFSPSEAKQLAPRLIPKINRKLLTKIWNRKRQEHLAH